MPKVTAKSWQAIRDEYATGLDNVTLKSIADKHGLKEQTVRTHAAKEKWSDARRQYRDRISTKTQEKASTREAEARVRHIGIGKLLQARGVERLSKLKVETLDADQARKLVESGVDIERKGLAIPEATSAQLNLHFTPEELHKMSIEELRELRAKIDG